MRRTWLALAACLALVLTSGGTAAAAVTAGTGKAVTAAERLPAGDGPPGFWWGTDSLPVTVPGSAPYSMPHLGGAYGGYIGMTGNWSYWLGCQGQDSSPTRRPTRAQAHTNYTKYHKGIGDGVYWFMGGPGVDPHYNGTTARRSAWGARQAARTLTDIAQRAHQLPGRLDGRRAARESRPPPTTAGTTCTPPRAAGVVRIHGIPAAVDRADFNGFCELHHRALVLQGRRLLRPERLGLDLRHRERGLDSRTPTSGPTSRRPRACPTPRSAGA